MGRVEQIKYHTSPYGDDDGILLVDVEDEAVPTTDADGNLLYYCPSTGRVFAANEDDED